MDIPNKGARYRAADGTVYVVEAAHDFSAYDDDAPPGSFSVEMVEESGLNDMSAAGFDLLDHEWRAFVAQHGLTLIP